MKKRIEDIIAREKIKIGIECIEKYPGAMIDKIVEKCPEMMADKMVRECPEMMTDKMVGKCAGMMADKMVGKCPEMMADKMVGKCAGMMADKMVGKHPGMMADKMVGKHPGMMADKMVGKHPGMMADKMVGKCPEMMADKMVGKCPEMMADKMVGKCPKMMSNKVLEECSEIVGENFLKNASIYLKSKKIKKEFIKCLKECLHDSEIYSKNVEFLFELDIFKEPNDWIVKRIVNGLTEDRNLFSKLFRRLVQNFPDLYPELMKNVPEIAKNIFLEIGDTGDILLGGIGKAEYSMSNSQFVVNGYYLPVGAFDTIEIYCRQELLGLAELGIKRPDVCKKVPNYDSLYSGWSFDIFLRSEIIPESVEVVVKSGDKVLKRECKEIEYINLEKIEIEEPYKISLNNFSNCNDIQFERIKNFNKVCEELNEYFNWKDINYFQTFLSLQKEIVYGSREIEELFLEIFYRKDVS